MKKPKKVSRKKNKKISVINEEKFFNLISSFVAEKPETQPGISELNPPNQEIEFEELPIKSLEDFVSTPTTDTEPVNNEEETNNFKIYGSEKTNNPSTEQNSYSKQNSKERINYLSKQVNPSRSGDFFVGFTTEEIIKRDIKEDKHLEDEKEKYKWRDH